jgi:hypothetical protein
MLDDEEPRRDAATWKALFMRKKNTTKPTGSATIPADVRIYFVFANNITFHCNSISCLCSKCLILYSNASLLCFTTDI